MNYEHRAHRPLSQILVMSEHRNDINMKQVLQKIVVGEDLKFPLKENLKITSLPTHGPVIWK